MELNQLKKSYSALISHKNRILAQRLWYIVLEQFLMKYVWSGTGMVMVSLPIVMGSVTSGKFILLKSKKLIKI